MEGERLSDKYNISSSGNDLRFGNGFTSGYGLGAPAFSASGGMSGSEARGLGSLLPVSERQAAPSALPAQQGFLIPYGGVDKYYPPPSPVKPSAVSTPFKAPDLASNLGLLCPVCTSYVCP